MGFHYTGPIDGHDVDALVGPAEDLKLKGPQLLHVITKGQGLPSWPKATRSATTRSARSTHGGRGRQGRREEAHLHRRVRRLAVRHGGGRSRAAGHHPGDARGLGLVRFSKEYPDRYFDVAIAEQHAVTWPRAWPAKAPSQSSRSTPPSCNAPTTSWSTTSPCRTCRAVFDRPRRRGRPGWRHPCRQPRPQLPALRAEHGGDGAGRRGRMPQDAEHRLPPRGPMLAVRCPRGTGPGVAVQPGLDTLPIGRRSCGAVARRPARVRRHRAAAERVARRTRAHRRQHAFVGSNRWTVLLDRAQPRRLRDRRGQRGGRRGGSGVAELLAEGIRPAPSACRTPSSTTPAAKRYWPKPASTPTASAPPSSAVGRSWRRPRAPRAAPDLRPRLQASPRASAQGDACAPSPLIRPGR